MRKVIQIMECCDESDSYFTALCDDGTIWRRNVEGWFKFPPIPQDEPEQSPDAIDLEGGL